MIFTFAFRYFVILLFSFLSMLLLFGCDSDADTRAENGKPLVRKNYVVLLDLSDRLLTEAQVQNDLEVIKQVMDQFVQTVKINLYVASHDRIKIVIAPQENSPVSAQAFHKILYLDMGQVPLNEKRNVEHAVEQLYAQVEQLYARAASYEKREQYQGADIWKYFNDQLEFDFTTDNRYTDRNYLVVLTDGYLDFEQYNGRRKEGNRYASTRFVSTLARKHNTWEQAFEQQDYGILALKDKDFSNLQVLVLEVSPHADYHYEILKATWQKWLKEAHIPVMLFLQKGNMATTREQIKQFFRGS
jgi:hypothetical protein